MVVEKAAEEEIKVNKADRKGRNLTNRCKAVFNYKEMVKKNVCKAGR